jgi:hypothetical protein
VRKWAVVSLLLLCLVVVFMLLRPRGAGPSVDFLNRDYRYDDTISLQQTYEAFLSDRFDFVDEQLAQMIAIERKGGRQTPFLGFLSMAGEADQYERCEMWKQALPESAFAWMCTGDALNNIAFRDHRDALAQDVKSGLSGSFTEIQLASERHYRKAEELDPDLAYASACLMGSDLVMGRDRATMEKNYSNALRKDPDCVMAYLMKAEYLKPDWFGTVQEYQDYVYQTAARFPRNTIIPLALIMNFHQGIMNYNREGDYFARPEVWAEIAPLLEIYLLANPNHHGIRSMYFRLAIVTRHPDIALQHAPLLLDKWGPLWKWGGWKAESVYHEMVIKHLKGDAERRRDEHKH